jgi:hypothetical protein
MVQRGLEVIPAAVSVSIEGVSIYMSRYFRGFADILEIPLGIFYFHLFLSDGKI